MVRETTATRTLLEISSMVIYALFRLTVNVNVSLPAIVQVPLTFVKSQRVGITAKCLSWSKGHGIG